MIIFNLIALKTALQIAFAPNVADDNILCRVDIELYFDLIRSLFMITYFEYACSNANSCEKQFLLDNIDRIINAIFIQFQNNIRPMNEISLYSFILITTKKKRTNEMTYLDHSID